MSSPRILVVLDTSAAWSRGILRGFAGVAHQADWTLLHYHPQSDLEWLVREWRPAALVLAPSCGDLPEAARTLPLVVVPADHTWSGAASVLPDETRVGELAATHLIEKGLRQVAVFRFDEAPFAVMRERSFCERARELGARVREGWWKNGASPPRSTEQSSALLAWLKDLPKPCGLFACCDSWARVVSRYCRVADIRIPDEIALVGADNDAIECELLLPPLSSVAIPWPLLGQHAARLVQQALAGESIAGSRVVVAPVEVVSRRSSEVMAIEDELVARAVTWICEHASQRMDVPTVARAVSASRQRLERRFHAVLGRTVLQEIRRAHIEIARQLLSTTDLPMPEVARSSGFTNQALLSVAFSKELGQPPSVYRRIARRMGHSEGDRDESDV